MKTADEMRTIATRAQEEESVGKGEIPSRRTK